MATQPRRTLSDNTTAANKSIAGSTKPRKETTYAQKYCY
jgi:hypothetical protein